MPRQKTEEGRKRALANLRPRKKGDPPLNLKGGGPQLASLLQKALDCELTVEDPFNKELTKKKAVFHLLTKLMHKSLVEGDIQAIKILLDRAFGPVTAESKIEVNEGGDVKVELLKSVQERIDELLGDKDEIN